MTADFSAVQSRQISSGKNRKNLFFLAARKRNKRYIRLPAAAKKLSAIVAKNQLEKIYFLQIIELSVAEIQNADLYF